MVGKELRAGLIAICTLIRYSCIFAVHMSPAFKGITALQRYECGSMVEIHNGIMFDFYLGLSHMYTVVVPVKQVGTCTPNGVSVSNSQVIGMHMV